LNKLKKTGVVCDCLDTYTCHMQYINIFYEYNAEIVVSKHGGTYRKY